jgi:transposase
VIRFLHAEGQSAAEIHRRLCRVYGDNVMSGSSVREWCRKFRDGRTDVHDEGGQGRHSTVTEELVEKVDQYVHGNRRSRYQNFLRNLHKFRGQLCIEL